LLLLFVTGPLEEVLPFGRERIRKGQAKNHGTTSSKGILLEKLSSGTFLTIPSQSYSSTV
jgi:hypothetical protein